MYIDLVPDHNPSITWSTYFFIAFAYIWSTAQVRSLWILRYEQLRSEETASTTGLYLLNVFWAGNAQIFAYRNYTIDDLTLKSLTKGCDLHRRFS